MTKVVPFSPSVSAAHDPLTKDEAWVLDHIEEDIDNIVHYTEAKRADFYRFLLRKYRQNNKPFSTNIVSRFVTENQRLSPQTTERFIIQPLDRLPQTSERRKYYLLMLLAQRVRSKVHSSVTLRAVP